MVYLDMTNPNTSSWKLNNESKRTCGRVSTSSAFTCDLVTFPVSGGDYTSSAALRKVSKFPT